MKKPEEPPFGCRFHPGREDDARLLAVTLGRGRARAGASNPVVIEVEPCMDARGSPKDVRGHGGPRRIAELPELCREGRNLRVEVIPDVVPHTVTRGQRAGEKRRMGGQSLRAVGEGPAVEDRLAPERIDRGSGAAIVSVGGQPVGAERIDGDDEDRDVTPRGLSALPAAGQEDDAGESARKFRTVQPAKRKPRLFAGASK